MVNGVLLLALWLVASATSYFAFVDARAGHPAATALILLAQAPFAVFALVRLHRDGVLGERTAPRAGDPTKGIVLAVLTYALAAGVVYLAFPPASELGTLLARLYLHFGDPGSLRRATLASTGLIFLVASTEELVFRSLATDLLSELIGSRRAWIASFLLFFSSLLPSMWALRIAGRLNPVYVVIAGLAGLVFAIAHRFGGGRVIFLVLAHTLFLWSVLLLYPLWAIR